MKVRQATSARDPFRYLYRRLVGAFVFLMTVAGSGTLGYHYMGDGRWTLFDCFYMSVVTLSTVGFAETLPGMNEVPGARGFTVLLIVLGSGTLLYFVSTFTAFVVEGDLLGVLKRRRMNKRIEKLEGHVVVCGVGSTGAHIVDELVATRTPFVAIDSESERLRRLDEETEQPLHYVVGDATDDAVLLEAGLDRARGIIAALHDDKDNLFVTVTARALAPNARIVAKAVEASAIDKLHRAGADSVVSPNRIGGMRLVSEMIRPAVVQFLDLMLRDKQRNLRLEELEIPSDSSMVGVALRDTDIRQKTDALVIAVRAVDGKFLYNPPPDTELTAGMKLVVLAETDKIIRLREGVLDGSIGRSR